MLPGPAPQWQDLSCPGSSAAGSTAKGGEGHPWPLLPPINPTGDPHPTAPPSYQSAPLGGAQPHPA